MGTLYETFTLSVKIVFHSLKPARPHGYCLIDYTADPHSSGSLVRLAGPAVFCFTHRTQCIHIALPHLSNNEPKFFCLSQTQGVHIFFLTSDTAYPSTNSPAKVTIPIGSARALVTIKCYTYQQILFPLRLRLCPQDKSNVVHRNVRTCWPDYCSLIIQRHDKSVFRIIQNTKYCRLLLFSILSDDRYKASSKTIPPHSAIQSLLFQMRVSSPVLKVIQ